MPAYAQSESPQTAASANDTEIVVTAQKRTERLLDVPLPVTAIAPQALLDRGQLRLEDYFNRVPGLNFSSSTAASNRNVAIRGLTSGSGNPTVALVVDDIPYGSATNLGGGNLWPDIDPGEIARLEVLRGPQGTLYGASSLGGLIKIVTVDPDPSKFSGTAQVGITEVYNSNRPGFNVRGGVNVPLASNLAVRVSGFTRREPGYIDNVVQGREGVNEEHVIGGRVSALWRPSDDFVVKASALLQDVDTDGAGHVTTVLGGLRQNDIRGTGRRNQEFEAYSLIAQANLGDVSITSNTGYNVRQSQDAFDNTASFGANAQRYFGVSGASLGSNFDSERFSQEVTANISIANDINLLVGGYYTRENSLLIQNIWPIDTATGNRVGVGFEGRTPTRYTERSIFTNLSLPITDAFKIQLGARQGWLTVTALEAIGTDVIRTTNGVPVTTVTPGNTGKFQPFTFSIAPEYHLSDNVMIYGRIASGFRPGGPNATTCTSFGFPCSFAPDETVNYEVGFKGEVIDDVLTVEASLYYIDWDGIQVNRLDPVSRVSYLINGGKATSKGFEINATLKPTEGLTFDGWFAYNRARLKEPLTVGGPLTQLPLTSPYSGRFNAHYDFAVGGDARVFVEGSVSYTDDRLSTVSATPLFLPAFTALDAATGFRSGPWTLTAALTNITNRRGSLSGVPAGPGTSARVAYIRPRALTVTLRAAF